MGDSRDEKAIEALVWLFAAIFLILLPPFGIQFAWNCLAPLLGTPHINLPQALSGWFFALLCRWFVRSCVRGGK